MKVYGLEGKSGTGKSFQAMNVCRERNIKSIIDDGLFIYDNAIQAGHSAKRDENKMTAIKTAIFNDEEERAKVAEAIKRINPESILVLGTSEGMINKICTRLELPEVSEMIHIEDIVSSEDIEAALQQRREKGKHVIPVPTFEIKNQFSGYFMRPLNKLKMINGKPSKINEKTVVRPTYSYLGEFTISDKAVLQLTEHVVSKCRCVAEVVKCTLKNNPQGVMLTIAAIFYYDEELRKHIEILQQRVAENVENMTAFNILAVNIIVKGMRTERGE
jgi:hypothetical protein